MNFTLRPAIIEDLPAITEMQNHYITQTHITFDIQPYLPEQRVAWFEEHSGDGRYRMLVACDERGTVAGYACTGRHRAKAGYDTTVEASIACCPNRVGRGLGTSLYRALFETIADQDIRRIVAGVAQPNPASNALHERFGFRRIGLFTEVGRKFSKYWDVLWMERPLRV